MKEERIACNSINFFSVQKQMKMPSTERFLGNERTRSVFDTHNRSSSAAWNSRQMNVLFLLRIASLLMCWLYIHIGTSAHPYDVRYHIWISTSIGFPSFLLFNRSSICSTLPSKTFTKEIAHALLLDVVGE